MERNDKTNTPVPRVVSHHRQARMVFRRENESVCYHFSKQMVDVHKKIWLRIDSLFVMHMCHVCNECYPHIQVFILHEGPICKICKSEKGAHRFSHFNNMDPGEQPEVLRILTQIEEMIIAWVNLILQMMHAHGGQYKYSGHMICFPQDISSIAKKLPRHVEEIDSFIVRGQGVQSEYYECYVKRQCVMDALRYKIEMDEYYRDVEINMDSFASLPERPTDVSSRLQYVDSHVDDVPRMDVETETYVANCLHFSHHPLFLDSLMDPEKLIE